MKKIQLDFRGYWREPNIIGMPAFSGIYCVYTCNSFLGKKVVGIELIYIGQSGDSIRDRIIDHEKWQDWRLCLGVGEELRFSCTRIENEPDRERAEAALIFQHKPQENDHYKDSFPFPDTMVQITGRHRKLTSEFTVSETE